MLHRTISLTFTAHSLFDRDLLFLPIPSTGRTEGAPGYCEKGGQVRIRAIMHIPSPSLLLLLR